MAPNGEKETAQSGQSEGFTVGNRHISRACAYVISEYFNIWVITARPSLLHADE